MTNAPDSNFSNDIARKTNALNIALKEKQKAHEANAKGLLVWLYTDPACAKIIDEYKSSERQERCSRALGVLGSLLALTIPSDQPTYDGTLRVNWKDNPDGNGEWKFPERPAPATPPDNKKKHEEPPQQPVLKTLLMEALITCGEFSEEHSKVIARRMMDGISDGKIEIPGFSSQRDNNGITLQHLEPRIDITPVNRHAARG